MSLITLQEILKESVKQTYAVGAFDSTDLYATEAILQAAEEEETPVILMIPNVGIMDRKNKEWYVKATVELIRASRVPVCLHLDHSGSTDDCIWAVENGFTSVMFDGSSLPFEENVEKTRMVVEAARQAGAGVEAEIGHVGNVAQQDWDKEEFYTRAEDAMEFVKLTDVDALAVAIGTIHGFYRGEARLDFERLREIREKIPVPLVLHGGTGMSDKDFVKVIQNGINKINIFTGLSMAAGDACREVARKIPEGPVHIMEYENALRTSICDKTKSYIRLFKNMGP